MSGPARRPPCRPARGSRPAGGASWAAAARRPGAAAGRGSRRGRARRRSRRSRPPRTAAARSRRAAAWRGPASSRRGQRGGPRVRPGGHERVQGGRLEDAGRHVGQPARRARAPRGRSTSSPTRAPTRGAAPGGRKTPKPIMAPRHRSGEPPRGSVVSGARDAVREACRRSSASGPPPPRPGSTSAVAPCRRSTKTSTNGRVELRAGDAAQLGERGLERDRRAIRVARRHDVEAVGHGEDARQQRDVVAGDVVRVAVPVDPLVLAQDDLRHLGVAVARVPTMSAPRCGCERISSQSSSVRRVPVSVWSGNVNLPTSCSSPAVCTSSCSRAPSRTPPRSPWRSARRRPSGAPSCGRASRASRPSRGSRRGAAPRARSTCSRSSSRWRCALDDRAEQVAVGDEHDGEQRDRRAGRSPGRRARSPAVSVPVATSHGSAGR